MAIPQSDPAMQLASTILQDVGAFAFGSVIGWYVYYVNRYRKGDVQLSDITTIIGAIGGAAVLAIYSKESDLFGAYGIGLAFGFFAYYFLLRGLVDKSHNFDSDWFLDGRRKDPADGYGYGTDARGGGTPMGPAQGPGSGIGTSQTFYIGATPTQAVPAAHEPQVRAAIGPAAAIGAPDPDDPASPAPGDVSDSDDLETGRFLANVGAVAVEQEPPAAAPAAPAPAVPPTIQINIADAQQFLRDCETSNPRVTYGLGAKVPFHGAVPGRDFKRVDCSGFVREAIWRATNPHVNFPDGSVVQHDWVRNKGFQHATVADGKLSDNHVRIAFLRPQDAPPPHHIGHVVLLSGGKTIESHGGVGPDSRPWTGQGWQANTFVYVLV
jgi:hypothetical protein